MILRLSVYNTDTGILWNVIQGCLLNTVYGPLQNGVYTPFLTFFFIKIRYRVYGTHRVIIYAMFAFSIKGILKDVTN